MHELTEDALVDILTKPRNALIKQYQKLFEMDGVKLRFYQRRAQGHFAGGAQDAERARGLRAIVENILLETMYEIPSHPNIKEVLVSEEVVEQNQQPLRIYHQKDAASASIFSTPRSLPAFCHDRHAQAQSTSPAATAGFAFAKRCELGGDKADGTCGGRSVSA